MISADLVILVFYGLILIYSVIGFLSGFSLKAIIVEFRSFTSIFSVYFLTRSAFLHDASRGRLPRVFFYIGAVVIIFALIEPKIINLWTDIAPVGKYMVDVKGLVNLYYSVSGVPDNFFRNGVRRFVSTFGEPLFFGYFAVAYFYFCAFSNAKNKWNYLILACIVFVLIFSYVRGAILSLVIGIVLGKFLCLSNKIKILVGATSSVLLSVTFLVYISIDSYTIRLEGSNLGHYQGLVYGLESVYHRILGVGVGGAGTFAGAITNTSYSNTENAILNLWLQAGVFSVATLLLIFLLWSKHMQSERNKKFKQYYMMVSCSILAMSLISPQIWALKTGFYYAFLIGYLVSERQSISYANRRKISNKQKANIFC